MTVWYPISSRTLRVTRVVACSILDYIPHRATSHLFVYTSVNLHPATESYNSLDSRYSVRARATFHRGSIVRTSLSGANFNLVFIKTLGPCWQRVSIGHPCNDLHRTSREHRGYSGVNWPTIDASPRHPGNEDSSEGVVSSGTAIHLYIMFCL